MNNMKRLAFSMLILFAVAGCAKYQNATDDASGDLYFRGRAFTYNTLTATPAKPLGNVTISLGYKKDNESDAITTTKTDSAGYFVFQNLKADTDYSLYGTHTEAGIAYKGRLDTTIKESVVSGQLIFNLNQNLNGVEYTVTDTGGGPVPGTAICYFTSFLVANDTCAGSVYRDTTNSVGKSTRFSLTPGLTYVTVFRAQFGNLVLLGRDTLANVQAQGLVRKRIIVR